MKRDAEQFAITVNDRLHLSALRPSDKPALVEYLNERAIYEGTLRIPFPYAESDADKFLAIDAEATEKHGHPVHFAIRDKSDSLIGGSGFDGMVYGHRAEIGYWLGRPFWGQGIMTAVVDALCGFAFCKWKLVRVTAHVFVFNKASMRVLEKNGFEFEGVLRKHQRKGDRFLDSRLYALVD